ncbi:hypothetical protein TYRP_016888 [Tyrophagus putrescentiae]|nr:hypothetical protein TYRP_016888 [Tyrophagus putrescentiae]
MLWSVLECLVRGHHLKENSLTLCPPAIRLDFEEDQTTARLGAQGAEVDVESRDDEGVRFTVGLGQAAQVRWGICCVVGLELQGHSSGHGTARDVSKRQVVLVPKLGKVADGLSDQLQAALLAGDTEAQNAVNDAIDARDVEGVLQQICCEGVGTVVVSESRPLKALLETDLTVLGGPEVVPWLLSGQEWQSGTEAAARHLLHFERNLRLGLRHSQFFDEGVRGLVHERGTETVSQTVVHLGTSSFVKGVRFQQQWNLESADDDVHVGQIVLDVKRQADGCHPIARELDAAHLRE